MLRTTGTLQRQTSTKAGGGPVAAYADVAGAVDVPCDVQPAGADEVLRFLQKGLVVSHTVYLASDIGAVASDLFITADGRTFLVLGGGYEPPATGYTQWPAQIHAQEIVGAP